jgi:hypothetical protein
VGAGPERDLTGVIAEHLPAGPGLAAWLGNADPAEFSDWDLPGIAAAYRRVASWALAGELAAVAAIASRTAARDARADLPRAFRTADLWLIHAADCRSRYSSRTCRGVRY